jgi:uncharacterized membrane protein YeaQ/YmgE (transglycosylase-associated protein family)
MIGTIVGAPGKQSIGSIITILLGALGSFIGTWVTYKLGYTNEKAASRLSPSSSESSSRSS